jgi:hypothetical protein
MRQRERDRWMGLLSAEREAHRKERQELLNRLAQPQVVRVDAPVEKVVAQTMTTTDLELSMVGREVPDGVTVGSLRDYVDP